MQLYTAENDRGAYFASLDGETWVVVDAEPDCSQVPSIKLRLQGERTSTHAPQLYEPEVLSRADLERNGIEFFVIECP